MKTSMEESKKKLTLLWVIMSTVLCIILFGQIFTRTTEYINVAMKWTLPKFFPTLALIIAAWVKDVTSTPEKMDIDSFVYKLTFYLSFAYLLMLILIFVFSLLSNYKTVDIMSKSDLLCTGFQGIVTASLGIFFVSAKSSKTE